MPKDLAQAVRRAVIPEVEGDNLQNQIRTRQMVVGLGGTLIRLGQL